MTVQDEINIQGNSINQKHNSAMSVMFCTGATFVKKNSYLVARIVSFDTVSLHLLTFHILQPYPSKDILTLMSLLQYPLSVVRINAFKFPYC